MAGCDRVVALAGDAYGYEASGDAVPAMDPPRSYTQWEYFFTLGERLDGSHSAQKDLYLYFASDSFLREHAVSQSAEQAARQQAFVKRLKDSGKHYGSFDSLEGLCRLVLRDGWRMTERPRKPRNLPYDSLGTLFKGREGFLDELHGRLRREPTHAAAIVSRQAVHGLGGVGKTRLAIEYALRHEAECCALLFVMAETPEALRRNLATLCEPLVLDLPEREAREEEIRVTAALRWQAADRIKNKQPEPGDEALLEDYESLEFWAREKLAKLDPKLRSSISATLNGACSLFDVPVVRRTFAPTPEDCRGKTEFAGFRDALARGLVVTVRVPGTQYKTVSNVVRTLMKLNFYDAVLERLSELQPGQRPRPCFFVADEFDQITTQPADGDYLARAREACAINVVATQSYAALVARFKDEHAARQMLANLRTQVWLGVNDADSAEEASKLCGDIDRERSTHSRGESTEDASWSWLDGRLMGHKGGSNEGVSMTVHRERLFPPGVFTALQKDQAVVRAFDGKRPLPPWVAYLKPYYDDPDKSWYADKRADAGDVRLATVREETPG